MIDKRVKGQSQLDYLWTNFGSYAVSNISSDENIPTTKLVIDLMDSLKMQSLSQLQVVNSYLVGLNSSNEELFRLNITEIIDQGKTVTNFGRRYTNLEDIENGNSLPLNTPVYFIKFSDGSEFISKIDNYHGFETDTIVTTINSNGYIKSNIKLDNDNSVIKLSSSNYGLKADIDIDNDEDGIILSKELSGLKAKIILENPDKILKFKYIENSQYLSLPNIDDTTVYFIKNKDYFYFGQNKIGKTIDLTNYYTKDEVNKQLKQVTNLTWNDLT